MSLTPEQLADLKAKVMEGQWKSVDRHRDAAFARIEEQCMGPDGILDWKTAEKMRGDWDERHGYHRRPKIF